jgi:hypothetical protein
VRPTTTYRDDHDLRRLLRDLGADYASDGDLDDEAIGYSVGLALAEYGHDPRDPAAATWARAAVRAGAASRQRTTA